TISTDSVFVLSISKHSSRTDIYTLPLHDALPISHVGHRPQGGEGLEPLPEQRPVPEVEPELSRHLVAGHPLGTFQKARLGLVVAVVDQGSAHHGTGEGGQADHQDIDVESDAEALEHGLSVFQSDPGLPGEPAPSTPALLWGAR